MADLELSDESAIESMNEAETELDYESAPDSETEPESNNQFIQDSRLIQVRADIKKLRDKYPDITQLSRRNRHLYIQLIQHELYLTQYSKSNDASSALGQPRPARPPVNKNCVLLYEDKRFVVSGVLLHDKIEKLISSSFHHLEEYNENEWEVYPRGVGYDLTPGTVYRISKEVKYPKKGDFFFEHPCLGDFLIFIFLAGITFILLMLYCLIVDIIEKHFPIKRS